MPIDTAHAERVYATAQQQSAAASSPIAASWRRCVVMHRLSPEDTREPLRLGEQDFRQARERAAHLIAESAEEMERLFLTIGKAGCCLLLTDTNGIGTALADERPVTIFRNQNFLCANTGLSCAAAPIRDHRGQVMAAIDISTAREDAHEMTLSMLSQVVRDAAGRIETNLFRCAFPGARIVIVPAAAGSTAALLAVDSDDLVVGATRAARLALKLDDARIAHGVAARDLLQEARHEKRRDLLEAERAALRRVLSRTDGNVSQAALLLGISRATMHRKMKRLALH